MKITFNIVRVNIELERHGLLTEEKGFERCTCDSETYLSRIDACLPLFLVVVFLVSNGGKKHKSFMSLCVFCAWESKSLWRRSCGYEMLSLSPLW